MNRLFLFISIFISISLFSCKSTKEITSKSTIKKIDEIFKTLDQNKVEYEWLYAKANIRIETANVNQSAKLYLRMRSDSLIWGSITYLFGIEVARFYIDKEQFTLIDKIRHQYYQYPFSYVEENYAIPDIDFLFIENLILGNPVYKITDGFKPTLSDSILILNKDEKGIDKNIFIDLKDVHISNYKIEKQDQNQKVELNYSDRIEDTGISIPANVEILLYLPEKNSVTLNFNSLQLNKSFSLSTSIPKGYEKME